MVLKFTVRTSPEQQSNGTTTDETSSVGQVSLRGSPSEEVPAASTSPSHPGSSSHGPSPQEHCGSSSENGSEPGLSATPTKISTSPGESLPSSISSTLSLGTNLGPLPSHYPLLQQGRAEALFQQSHHHNQHRQQSHPLHHQHHQQQHPSNHSIHSHQNPPGHVMPPPFYDARFLTAAAAGRHPLAPSWPHQVGAGHYSVPAQNGNSQTLSNDPTASQSGPDKNQLSNGVNGRHGMADIGSRNFSDYMRFLASKYQSTNANNNNNENVINQNAIANNNSMNGNVMNGERMRIKEEVTTATSPADRVTNGRSSTECAPPTIAGIKRPFFLHPDPLDLSAKRARLLFPTGAAIAGVWPPSDRLQGLTSRDMTEEPSAFSTPISRNCPEGQDNPASSGISRWSVDDVAVFIANLDECQEYAKIFKMHGIDGAILPLISADQMVSQMRLKLGAAIRIRAVVSALTNQCLICSHCLHCHDERLLQQRRQHVLLQDDEGVENTTQQSDEGENNTQESQDSTHKSKTNGESADLPTILVPVVDDIQPEKMKLPDSDKQGDVATCDKEDSISGLKNTTNLNGTS